MDTFFLMNGDIYVASTYFCPWSCWFLCSEVRIEGLETLDYFDNLFQRERCTEQGDALTFESEVLAS